MKVVKFGGSSLANGPQLEKVLNIMLADTDNCWRRHDRYSNADFTTLS